MTQQRVLLDLSAVIISVEKLLHMYNYTMFLTLTPLTSTRTAKLVRWVLEHWTVDWSPLTVIFSVVTFSTDQPLSARLMERTIMGKGAGETCDSTRY